MYASTKQNSKRNHNYLFWLIPVVVVAIIASVMIGITLYNEEPIEMVDLAATYKGEIKDVDGNLLVPFDVAYPEAFASGEYEYRKDALLLKMEDGYNGRLTRTLKKCGFVSIEPTVNTVNGQWYEAKVAEGEDVTVVIQKVRSLSYVHTADFDYIIKATDTEVESIEGEIDISDINSKVHGNGQLKNQWFLKSAGIQDAWKELEKKGLEPGGSPSVVVAVIDTGVDYTHPDLKANIWVNANEIPDNGRDDDGNGYVDDYYGFDTVANRGNGMDVHGHGTHVAGIIAASNNKEGVVGIAYNAKIMPIAAGQATGIFLQNDIAEAIIYAYEMGADVINMSFGGSACSIAVQDALMTAYSRATLVAAAGNDGMPNEGSDYYPALPSYPGALSYVIGVMSVNRSDIESGFSNWDTAAFNKVEYEVYAPGEGIYSTLAGGGYGNLSGTSMAAPTVSGIAALLRSYYTDRDMYPSKFIQAQLCATSEDEAICGNPEKHTVGGRVHGITPYVGPGNYTTGVMMVNAYTAITKLPKPDVNLYDYYIFDGVELSEKNNGDGVADAGETIDIGIVLRNRWGMSKDTVVTIDALSYLGEDAPRIPNPYVEFIIDSENYDSVGTYSTKSMLIYNEENFITGYEKPLRVKISDDCPNDYLIGINVEVSCRNALDEGDTEVYSNYTLNAISFGARRGVILPSQITEDMTLTSDNLYIIPNATYIHKGVTVTAEPGTRIQFWSDDPDDVYAQTAITYLTVEGSFICQGSEEEYVELFPSDLMSQYRVEIKRVGDGEVDLSYTTVTNPYLYINTADHCTFRQNYSGYLYYRELDNGVVKSRSTSASLNADVTNSIIYKCGSASGTYSYSDWRPMYLYGSFDTCAFVDSMVKRSSDSTYTNCAFIGNYATNEGGSIGVSSITFSDQFMPTVGKIVKDPKTGKTYVSLNVAPSGYSPKSYIDNVRPFVEYVGGNILRIETLEELNFLQQNNMSYGYVDWKYGKTTWENGDPIPEFLLNMEVEGDYEGYMMLYGNMLSTAGHGYPVYIELPGSIYCDTIQLDEYSAEIDMESGYQLNPTVIPASFDVNELIYVSEDPAIASVSESGLITPVSKGETRIFVYAPDYQCKAVLRLSVTEKVRLEGLKLPTANSVLKVGDSVTLQPEYIPANTTERLLSFATSDESVLTVSDRGVVTAVGTGTATITASGANGASATYTVKVIEPVESISFTDKFYVTFEGDTDTSWQPTVLPADASEYTLKWSSSNPEIAYVNDEGELVRKAIGTATIRVEIEGTDLYADLNVSVSNPDLLSNAKVVEMDSYNGYVYAVTDTGELWVWGGGAYRVPVKACEGVKDVIASNAGNNNILYILKMDGTVERGYISGGKYDSYPAHTSDLRDIIALESAPDNHDSWYALRSDGTVWAWGENSHGELGDGTTADRSSPIQMGVTNVKKVVPFCESVLLLTNDGKAYCYGTDDRYVEAELIAENAVDVRGSYYDVIVETAGGTQKRIHYTGEVNTIDSYTDWTWYMVSNSNFRIKGEQIYWRGGTLECPDIEKILYISGSSSDLFYYVTTDGKLYGVGKNASFQLADLTATARNTPTRIFFGLGTSSDAPVIEDVNITDGKLTDDTLTLDFNKALIAGGEYGYITIEDSDGQLSMQKMLILDKLTLAPLSGWKHGETYTVTIPASAMLDMYGNNTAQVVYTFTYTNNEPIAQTGASIANGAVLTDKTIDLSIAYTVANRGELFDSILITRDGVAVEGITVALANNELTLVGELDYGNYTLTIPAGALCDNVGGKNEESVIGFSVVHTLSFTDSSVEDGELRADERENITLTFEGALEGESFGAISLTTANGTPIATTVALVDGVLTVAHEGLAQGTAYVLTIPEGALADATGTANETIIIRFKTYAPVAIDHASLSAGNQNVALLPEFSFIYNGEFTLDATKLTLVDGNGNPVALSAAVDGNRLMLTPDEALADATTYTLTLLEGAMTDERGAISESASYTFTTLDAIDRFFWSQENLGDKIDEWIKEGYNNYGFTGNAILNNFQDTNVEHWLRIAAGYYQSSEAYMKSIGLAGNWWGTTNEELIGLQILDFDDFQSLADINFKNYLTSAPETTFPFVTSAYLLNSNGERVDRVSNETVTFVVEFNRDMDTSVPLRVRFGSSMPYAEYEITGEYVSARRWEGTYTLKTTIENGRQFINIENGRAADDHYLQLFETDSCRFGFEIDTTGAQAMMMQATATATGIQLSWMQDDFDTLAGYNVYRSTKEDGLYVRLNDFIIPADVTTFFDATVEPGVHYYYNFTVVKTDFSESTPSGKINLMSMDTMAPGIYHSPIRNAFTSTNLIISATVTDNLMLRDVQLFYRTTGTDEWSIATMTNHNDRWSAVVPAELLSTDGLEYYIRAFDGINYTYSGTALSPYSVTVQLAIDASAKGDVNGDGVITNIDALMLLQAANDLLNLTPEQFLRADLNGDEELSAAEALRILKYANGSITTLMG